MVNIHRPLGKEIFFKKTSQTLLTRFVGVRITRLIDGGAAAGDRVLRPYFRKIGLLRPGLRVRFGVGFRWVEGFCPRGFGLLFFDN